MKKLASALSLVAVAACGRGSATLPFYRSAAMSPEWLAAPVANATSMHRVAPFRLVDQHGIAITNAAFAGKVSIVHFFFTSCGDVCPTTTRNIASLLRATAGDERIQVLSHSVMPDSDSVEALHRYAETHGIRDARWHLLTGPKSSIESLARGSYFVRLGDDTTYGRASIAHSESVLLIDGKGRLRGVYAGSLQLEMDRLRDDVVALLAESA